METSADTLDVNDRANDLYWTSDKSVNQIAEDLDLSKGALYGMIRPLPSGLACPGCGEEAVHPNRTAHERGMIKCEACDWSGSEEDATALAGDSTAGEVRHPGATGSHAPHVDDSDERRLPERVRETVSDHGRIVAGGALLGAAAGLALVLWARRR